MAIWNDKWFAGLAMPPNSFPQHLIEAAQSIAEEWLFDASFRCILTEWVSATRQTKRWGACSGVGSGSGVNRTSDSRQSLFSCDCYSRSPIRRTRPNCESECARTSPEPFGNGFKGVNSTESISGSPHDVFEREQIAYWRNLP